jgi:hypothetical protein
MYRRRQQEPGADVWTSYPSRQSIVGERSRTRMRLANLCCKGINVMWSRKPQDVGKVCGCCCLRDVSAVFSCRDLEVGGARARAATWHPATHLHLHIYFTPASTSSLIANNLVRIRILQYSLCLSTRFYCFRSGADVDQAVNILFRGTLPPHHHTTKCPCDSAALSLRQH